MGVLFGFVFHFGPQGLWWGLSLGLCVAAILLQWRLRTHK
jgi:Na+-driven multidrug efflux pump